MYPRKRFLIPLIFATLFFIYFYKNPEDIFYVQKLFGIAPCQKPITYKIEDLDSGFNLSKEEFIKNLKQAELVWEKSIGINLFEYNPEGKIKVSLIYDYRQETTNALKTIDKNISSSRREYERLKSEYLSLKNTYETKDREYDSLVLELNKDKINFEQKIKSWNQKGGAPENVYQELNIEKQELQNRITELNKINYELNGLISTINQKASNLNNLAKSLNLHVDTYNTVGQKTAKEFNEGIYEQKGIEQSIKIYQFENKTKLIRVLAHEFGHALNLDHINEKEAIMYELNTSNNMTPTQTELNQLKQICHVN